MQLSFAELSGEPVAKFLPRLNQPTVDARTDVLIWQGCLLRRESNPNNPGILRKSLICHYSGATHRRDLPARAMRSSNSQPCSGVHLGRHNSALPPCSDDDFHAIHIHHADQAHCSSPLA